MHAHEPACAANHHPSLTTRMPTFERLRRAGDMGLWSSRLPVQQRENPQVMTAPPFGPNVCPVM